MYFYAICYENSAIRWAIYIAIAIFTFDLVDEHSTNTLLSFGLTNEHLNEPIMML